MKTFQKMIGVASCVVVAAACFSGALAQSGTGAPEVSTGHPAPLTREEILRALTSAQAEGQAKSAEKQKAAQQEAEKLSTKEVFDELQRLDAARAVRIAQSRNFDDALMASWGDDDSERKFGFGAVLDSRRSRGDAAASFYYALRNWKLCEGLQGVKGYEVKVAECWKNTLDAFKVASAAQEAAATFNIGRMYEGGFGVIASKYAAADWYVKSAEQYNTKSSREEALTSLESALLTVPDHPAALRLRAVMLR